MDKKIKIILDIFSGRPNPEWELEQNDENVLKERIGSLSSPIKSEKPVGLLGYRGFIIESGGKEGLPEEIAVFDGKMFVTKGKEIKAYEDKNNLENWLIEKARKKDYGQLIDKFRRVKK